MRITSRFLHCTLSVLSLCSVTHAWAEDTSPWSANLSLQSDYRFRGISQTWKQPALQAGLDYADPSGWYAGTWMSRVSTHSYNNGSSLEWDVYGGYKWPLADGTLDLGAVAYLYPGARMNMAPGLPSGDKYTNLDLALGYTQGGFSAKWSVAATDYFGLKAGNAGYAYYSGLATRGGSAGTHYLDLNQTVALNPQWTLGLHLGHLTVRHYRALSYTDARISLSTEMAGLSWTAAWVGTTADATYYQAANPAATRSKRLGTSGLVLGVTKTF